MAISLGGGGRRRQKAPVTGDAVPGVDATTPTGCVMREDQPMSSRPELRAFLRSRRERVLPEDVGIATVGRRRVPGLRRDELSRLAGVSVDYYTQLEQGRDINPSEPVLDALARAL